MPHTSCWLEEPCECTAEEESCWDTYQRGTASFALAPGGCEPQNNGGREVAARPTGYDKCAGILLLNTHALHVST